MREPLIIGKGPAIRSIIGFIRGRRIDTQLWATSRRFNFSIRKTKFSATIFPDTGVLSSLINMGEAIRKSDFLASWSGAANV